MRSDKYKRCEMPWIIRFEIMMPLDSPVKVEHFLFRDHGDLIKGGCLIRCHKKSSCVRLKVVTSTSSHGQDLLGYSSKHIRLSQSL